MDKVLLVGGMSLIVLLVSLVIGAAITDKTNAVAYNVTRVYNASGADVTPSNITKDVTASTATTYTTFTGFIPIAVMAMVGAVALFYLWSVLGGTAGRTN